METLIVLGSKNLVGAFLTKPHAPPGNQTEMNVCCVVFRRNTTQHTFFPIIRLTFWFPGGALVSSPKICHFSPSFRSSFRYFVKKIQKNAVDVIRQLFRDKSIKIEIVLQLTKNLDFS